MVRHGIWRTKLCMNLVEDGTATATVLVSSEVGQVAEESVTGLATSPATPSRPFADLVRAAAAKPKSRPLPAPEEMQTEVQIDSNEGTAYVGPPKESLVISVPLTATNATNIAARVGAK